MLVAETQEVLVFHLAFLIPLKGLNAALHLIVSVSAQGLQLLFQLLHPCEACLLPSHILLQQLCAPVSVIRIVLRAIVVIKVGLLQLRIKILEILLCTLLEALIGLEDVGDLVVCTIMALMYPLDGHLESLHFLFFQHCHLLLHQVTEGFLHLDLLIVYDLCLLHFSIRDSLGLSLGGLLDIELHPFAVLIWDNEAAFNGVSMHHILKKHQQRSYNLGPLPTVQFGFMKDIHRLFH
mmetsp:Transcript_143757/g.250935  ORF Transcript_143757/g.250935 Transcript_143757/m.250935 type:complete len:236 (+) Transcript_143757:2024-2731(+)